MTYFENEFLREKIAQPIENAENNIRQKLIETCKSEKVGDALFQVGYSLLVFGSFFGGMELVRRGLVSSDLYASMVGGTLHSLGQFAEGYQKLVFDDQTIAGAALFYLSDLSLGRYSRVLYGLDKTFKIGDRLVRNRKL